MSSLTDGTHSRVILGELVPGPLVLLPKLFENESYNGPPVIDVLTNRPQIDVVKPPPQKPAFGLGDDASFKMHKHLQKFLNETIENKTLLASRDWR